MKHLAKACLFGLISLAGAGRVLPAAAGYFLYAGTFNRPTPATTSEAKGIYGWRFDPAAGALAPLGLVAETDNAASLCTSPDQSFLYAVNWATGKPGGDTLSAYAIDRKTGALALLNRVSSYGDSPNQVVLDPSGRIAVAVTFHGGTVVALAVTPSGRLGQTVYVEKHDPAGAGTKGALPHPHGVAFSPDGRFAYVADLGLDRLYTYEVEAKAGRLFPADPPFVPMPVAGSGPRRLQVHPNGRFIYVAHETNSQVSVFTVDGGRLRHLQTLPAAPPGFQGKNSPAEILLGPAGRWLYVGNRGSDTLAWFAVEAHTGRLTLAGHVPVGGRNPRNMGLDPTGRFLIVSNQTSDQLVVFALDSGSGRPTPTGTTAKVIQPGGICFAQAAQ